MKGLTMNYDDKPWVKSYNNWVKPELEFENKSYIEILDETFEKYKDKPVIVVCRSGSRSASGCAMLKKQGFDQVYNLRGGLMAWKNANLPIAH